MRRREEKPDQPAEVTGRASQGSKGRTRGRWLRRGGGVAGPPREVDAENGEKRTIRTQLQKLSLLALNRFL